MADDQERIVVMVAADLKERFLKALDARGQTQAFVIRSLIDNWTSEHLKKKPKKKAVGY